MQLQQPQRKHTEMEHIYMCVCEHSYTNHRGCLLEKHIQKETINRNVYEDALLEKTNIAGENIWYSGQTARC